MPTHATRAQIENAYKSLTQDDLIALRRMACQFLGGSRFSSPGDLIQQTLVLLLTGKRKWPINLDFLRYMRATMRSVASNQRKRKEFALDSGRDIDEMFESGNLDFAYTESVEVTLVQAEPIEILRRTAAKARASLKDDPTAQLVIDSIFAGYEPQEACAELGIDFNEYRAARQRAIIRMKRYAGGGLD